MQGFNQVRNWHNFSDSYLSARFLLKAIRRHPSEELRFSVVICIMKGFPFSNIEILSLLFTLPISSSLLLGDCCCCCSESELTQTTHSLTIGKNSNISTWFTFPRVLCFSTCLPCSYYEAVINTGYLNCFLAKRENQTYF